MPERSIEACFALPWRESRNWVWDACPEGLGCAAVSLVGGGRRGLAEIRAAFAQRRRIRHADVVLAWELRSALAVRLVLGRSRPWIAVAPIVKGPWAKSHSATGGLLRCAARVVWMSHAESRRFGERLGLDPLRMLADRVPWPVRPLSSEDDGTWLAAGRSHRDWDTLGKASVRARRTGFVAGAAGVPFGSEVECCQWISGEELDRRIDRCGFHVASVAAVEHGCGQSMILRAAMAGKPSIATDLDVLEEYLPPGAALRVPHGDVDALSDAMGTLAADASLRTAMGELASEDARASTFSEFGRRMLALATEVREGFSQ
ncbi:MAG: hypothetical protein ACKO5K_16320 [Armatimonadota bacterium]